SQNSQSDAAYCSYCGSSLAGAKDSISPPSQPGRPAASPTPMPSYPSSSQPSYSFSTSERYELALKRTEQLATAIAILSVVALILVFVP
ncbi:MAG: hypothetical protein PXY39_03755, partial [archaeon]|nr:hypothetical protein [archaeon]